MSFRANGYNRHSLCCAESRAGRGSWLAVNVMHKGKKVKLFSNDEVAKLFSAYPAELRSKLLVIRDLIFSVAEATPGVGVLEETLKWSQLSYVTTETKSGSTIRVDAVRSVPGSYAIYFHCQTTLVATFKKRFGRKFTYEGNRALIFRLASQIPKAELRECIAEALTYHLKKKTTRGPIGMLIR